MYFRGGENLNTYERMFHEDVQEKRKIGRGSFNRVGKGVKHTMRGIKTPYDFMSTKEKKKLNSEVREFNMYETILDRQEFDKHDKDTQRAMLIKWRELYQNVDIMAAMGIRGSNTFHNLIKEFELPPKPRGGARNTTPKRKATTRIAEQPQEMKPIEIVSEKVQQNPVKILINGLHLEYNGIYDSDQLSRIFTKLQLLTDGENSDYYLTLTLTEEQKTEDKKEAEIF
jgi:hypothetical protein